MLRRRFLATIVSTVAPQMPSWAPRPPPGMARLTEYRKFLRAGYSLRELVAAYVRLQVVSWWWTRLKYPLRKRGARVCIDCTVEIAGTPYIEIGDDSWVQRGAWLVVPLIEMPALEPRAYLRLGNRVQVGRHVMIGANHSVELEDDVLVGPRVTIVDYTHRYDDWTRPIRDQGLTQGGFVKIGRGAFIAAGAAILGHRGLTIGEHAVVGANSVVTQDVPPYCVAVGNPARIVKRLEVSGAVSG